MVDCVGVIVSFATFVVLCFTLWVLNATRQTLGSQLEAIGTATASDGFLRLADRLDQPGARRARQLLYQNRGIPQSLDDDDRQAIETVLTLLDELGCLVEIGVISENVALPIYWDVVIKCWDASSEWIETERGRRREGYRDTFLANFEALVRRCRRYREEQNFAPPEIYPQEGA